MRALVCVALLVCISATCTVPVSAVSAVEYAPPVNAPVIDEFRPPAHRYGSGNRGLTYGTRAGQPVHAAGDGVVAFAGQVGGRLVVSIDHADGLRTTYSDLGELRTARGTRVVQGERIGVAAAELHFGVRAGSAYLDPAELLSGLRRVYLIADPIDRPLPPGVLEWRSGGGLPGSGALGWLVDRGGDAVDLGELVLDEGVGVLSEATGAVLRLASEVWADLRYLGDTLMQWSPMEVLGRMVEVFQEWRKECTPSGTAVPPPPTERRILVVIGGLGSNSDDGLVEEIGPDDLGYDDGDVVRFSYDGGAVPGTGRALGLEERGYDGEHTEVGVRESAAELDALLADIRAAAPGVPIDIVAHSLGGVVTREVIGREGTGVQRVVTLGTPHRGSDLASLARSVSDTDLAQLVGIADDLTGDRLPDFGSDAVADLAETSDVIRELPPVADDVALTSVAVQWDPVVASPQTRVPGQRSTVVDGGTHGGLPGSEAGRRETALALGGLPPTCRGLLASFGDAASGELVSLVTDAAGMGALYLEYQSTADDLRDLGDVLRDGRVTRTPGQIDTDAAERLARAGDDAADRAVEAGIDLILSAAG
ncbi:MAG: peptidoglycan DD-metalloendopeptidase family protein [Actinomycetota bacterium]